MSGTVERRDYGRSDGTVSGAAERKRDPTGAWQEAPSLSRHGIVPDESGRAAYRDLFEHSARWRAYVQSLPGDSPRAPSLVEDLFFALYQSEVKLNPAVDPGFHRNFAALAALLPLAAFAKLRRETEGDAVAAAMAARRLADDLLAREAAEGGTRGRSRLPNPLAALLPKMPRLLHRRRRSAEASAPEPSVDGLEAPEAGSEGGEAVRERQAPGAAVRAANRALEQTLQDRHLRRVWGIEPGIRSARRLDDVWGLVQSVRELPGFEQLTGAFADMTELLQPAARGRGRRHRRRLEQRRYEKLQGLTRGRDLERVVPEEMVRLLDDDMAGLFHEAYEHRRLLQERYGSKPPESPGPLVVCLDVSRSMNTVAAGGRERFAWAKGVGLALLDAARRTERPFLGLCFSSETESASFAMEAGEWRPEVAVELARCDFDGGTHFQTPLTKAMEYVEGRMGRGPGRSPAAPAPLHPGGPVSNDPSSRRTGPGHIVFVTDGEAALPAAFVRRFEEARRRLGFRLFTVFIDGFQDELVALSDRTFVVEGGRFQSWERAAAGLARALARSS